MNNIVTGTQGLNAMVYLSICVMLALTWNKTALNGAHEINTKRRRRSLQALVRHKTDTHIVTRNQDSLQQMQMQVKYHIPTAFIHHVTVLC